ncbi:MAG: hypothetical protein BGO68_04070 [Candidatus Amoebophilus sp. 36-38]|nr:MAG: hypothetical protein BGO68_04070 [Candidatus Amoebophilus sp. 36-38]
MAKHKTSYSNVYKRIVVRLLFSILLFANCNKLDVSPPSVDAQLTHEEAQDTISVTDEQEDTGLVQQAQIGFYKLPIELQSYIFSFLNHKGLLKASKVCQSWRKAVRIIMDAEMHALAEVRSLAEMQSLREICSKQHQGPYRNPYTYLDSNGGDEYSEFRTFTEYMVKCTDCVKLREPMRRLRELEDIEIRKRWELRGGGEIEMSANKRRRPDFPEYTERYYEFLNDINAQRYDGCDHQTTRPFGVKPMCRYNNSPTINDPHEDYPPKSMHASNYIFDFSLKL